MLAFFKKKKSQNEIEKEEIQNFLKNVYLNSLEERDNKYNKHFNDCLSLVFLVNEDFPNDVQFIYTLYCLSNFLYTIKNNQDFIEWKERLALNGNKNHIIMYKMGAKDLLNYFKNNYQNIKSASIISHNNISYPIVLCLGFIWSNKLKDYDEKMVSIRM